MISVPALPVKSFSLIKLKLDWNCDYIMLLFHMFQLLYIHNSLFAESKVITFLFLFFIKSCLSLIGSLIHIMG
jgi:hypothetical protein